MQDDIAAKIRAQLDVQDLNITLDGNRALIEVTSTQFADMNRVQKQQAVYACIEDFIADGSLHAVTIKANDPASD